MLFSVTGYYRKRISFQSENKITDYPSDHKSSHNQPYFRHQWYFREKPHEYRHEMKHISTPKNEQVNMSLGKYIHIPTLSAVFIVLLIIGKYIGDDVGLLIFSHAKQSEQVRPTTLNLDISSSSCKRIPRHFKASWETHCVFAVLVFCGEHASLLLANRGPPDGNREVYLIIRVFLCNTGLDVTHEGVD